MRCPGATVLTEDKLFATLDPTTRRVTLPNGRDVLFSDTVGFIQKLPTELVAAFRATLEEINEADLILHVVDSTHPNACQQSETVMETLAELGVVDQPVLTVLNKIDGLPGQPLAGIVWMCSRIVWRSRPWRGRAWTISWRGSRRCLGLRWFPLKSRFPTNEAISQHSSTSRVL